MLLSHFGATVRQFAHPCCHAWVWVCVQVAMLRRLFQSISQKGWSTVLLRVDSQLGNFKDKNEEIRDRLVIGILDKELSLELQLKADLTLENCVDRVRNSEMVKKQNEVVKGVDHVFLAGVGEVDFTRALSQRVLEDVQIVTYSLIIATRNVLRKMKFAIIVARKVTMHVAVDQIVRLEVQVVVQIEV